MGIKIDYTKTPIFFYRFFYLSVTNNDCNYVGSTTNVTRRKSEHKSRCYDISNKEYNNKLYTMIRNTGGFDNWRLVILETRICVDKIDRLKREQEYINLFNCSNCNTNRAHVSPEMKIAWMKEYQKNAYINRRLKLKQEQPEQTSSDEVFLDLIPTHQLV